MTRYLLYSRSAYYGIVSALPLLIAYEVLLMIGGMGRPPMVRNAADVWMRMLLESLEVAPQHATLVMIFLLILAIPMVRKRGITLEPTYFLLMLGESIIYSLLFGGVINALLQVLGILINTVASGVAMAGLSGATLSGTVAAAVPLATPFGANRVELLALSLGAGLFEEFLFRVVLLGVLLLVTRAVLAGWLAAVVSTVAAAFLFSLAHYVGPMAQPLELSSFLFRWIAGLLFTILYYLRGFGVTAITHALYDVWLLVF